MQWLARGGGKRKKNNNGEGLPCRKRGRQRSWCCKEERWVVIGGSIGWGAAYEVAKVVAEKGGKKKKLGRDDFFSTLASHFSSFRLWNPSLFIRGGRGTFVSYGAKSWPLIRLGRILTVSSNWLSWAVSFVAKEGLVRLVTLGRYQCCCGVNWPELIILGCS